ncbi:MAG: hypothetical protein ABSH08_16935 [Tepidisphaeraceae bacterium]
MSVRAEYGKSSGKTTHMGTVIIHRKLTDWRDFRQTIPRSIEDLVMLNDCRGLLLRLGAATVVLALLSGCTGTTISYSPKERMVLASSHNHFLEMGPCGAPWNYDDQINILLPANCDQCDGSQLVVYQNGKLKVDSGSVILDRKNKTVTIDLTFEGYDHVPVKCKYNGVWRYVEQEPQQGDVTRQWLQDFYRTQKTVFYDP